MVKSGSVLLALIFILTACKESRPVKSMPSKQVVKMGTYLRLQLPEGHDDLYLQSLKLVDELDNELSHYRDTSRLNEVIKNGLACTSKHFKNLVAASYKINVRTRGRFNIFYKSKIKNPVLKVSECGVSLSPVGAEFDFGAIGKGYTVDQIRDLWLTNGVKQGVIAFSGDITCLHKGCQLAVQNPSVESEQELLSFRSKVYNISISTSGNYRRQEHIPTKNQFYKSVTLIGRAKNTDLDAYTTAAFLTPIKELEPQLLFNNLAYILLTDSDELVLSKNLDQFVEGLDLKEIPKSIRIVKRAP